MEPSQFPHMQWNQLHWNVEWERAVISVIYRQYYHSNTRAAVISHLWDLHTCIETESSCGLLSSSFASSCSGKMAAYVGSGDVHRTRSPEIYRRHVEFPFSGLAGTSSGHDWNVTRPGCQLVNTSGIYSGPSLSGHSQQRPPSLARPQILAITTINVLTSPYHQRPPL